MLSGRSREEWAAIGSRDGAGCRNFIGLTLRLNPIGLLSRGQQTLPGAKCAQGALTWPPNLQVAPFPNARLLRQAGYSLQACFRRAGRAKTASTCSRRLSTSAHDNFRAPRLQLNLAEDLLKLSSAEHLGRTARKQGLFPPPKCRRTHPGMSPALRFHQLRIGGIGLKARKRPSSLWPTCQANRDENPRNHHRRLSASTPHFETDTHGIRTRTVRWNKCSSDDTFLTFSCNHHLLRSLSPTC